MSLYQIILVFLLIFCLYLLAIVIYGFKYPKKTYIKEFHSFFIPKRFYSKKNLKIFGVFNLVVLAWFFIRVLVAFVNSL